MSPTPEAEWFARRQDPETARRTEDLFQSWLLSDPENVVRYAQCELAWERTSELAHDPDVRRVLNAANGRLPAALAEQRRERPPYRPILWAAAALVILAITSAVTFHHLDRTIYETAKGEQRDIVLAADGSRVTLNTATRIVVEYTDDLRRIVLLDGEALFDVREDPARPFEVVAGPGIARAIGTRFVVRRSVDAITVSVLDGVVEVERGGEDAHTTENLVPALEVGQAVLLDIDGSLSAVVPANVRRIQAWQNRKIEFDDEPLAAAIAEVNRYSSKPFKLGDDGLSDIRVSGVFRIAALQGFEFAVRESLGLRVVDNGREIVILPPKQRGS